MPAPRSRFSSRLEICVSARILHRRVSCGHTYSRLTILIFPHRLIRALHALRKLTHSYDFLGLRTDVATIAVSRRPNCAPGMMKTLPMQTTLLEIFLNGSDHTGRFDRSIVIVSADHGESFEHGWLTHGGPYLFNSLIRHSVDYPPPWSKTRFYELAKLPSK